MKRLPIVIAVIFALTLAAYVSLAVALKQAEAPVAPHWQTVEPSEASAHICAAHGELAKLVSIYNYKFEFEEARCYAKGGVN